MPALKAIDQEESSPCSSWASCLKHTVFRMAVHPRGLWLDIWMTVEVIPKESLFIYVALVSNHHEWLLKKQKQTMLFYFIQDLFQVVHTLILRDCNLWSQWTTPMTGFWKRQLELSIHCLYCSGADMPRAALAVTALEATSSFKEAQVTPSIWLREILRCCDC